MNVKTYQILVGLQTWMPDQLNKTWTQDPVTFEDALGRVAPLHLEFINSWDVSFDFSYAYVWAV
jgi:hypothetical protein